MNQMTPAYWLTKQYEKRHKRNPNYSKRSFANSVGISSGAISELLSGKRTISIKQAEKISHCLELSSEEHQFFIEIVEKALEKKKKQFLKLEVSNQYEDIDLKHFDLISDPNYQVLFCLIETKDFQNNTSWIAERMGISTEKVKKIIDCLIELNLVREENKYLKLTNTQYSTPTDIPSSMLRKSHKDSLQFVIDQMDHVEINARDITSMTIPVNKSKIPEAKKLIQDFRRGLSKLLETGEKDEVYNINIQLMPLTGLSTPPTEEL